VRNYKAEALPASQLHSVTTPCWSVLWCLPELEMI